MALWIGACRAQLFTQDGSGEDRSDLKPKPRRPGANGLACWSSSRISVSSARHSS